MVATQQQEKNTQTSPEQQVDPNTNTPNLPDRGNYIPRDEKSDSKDVSHQTLNSKVDLSKVKVSQNESGIKIEQIPFVEKDGKPGNQKDYEYVKGEPITLYPEAAKNVVISMVRNGAQEFKLGEDVYDLTNPKDRAKLIKAISSDPDYECQVSKAKGQESGTIYLPGQITKPEKFAAGADAHKQGVGIEVEASVSLEGVTLTQTPEKGLIIENVTFVGPDGTPQEQKGQSYDKLVTNIFPSAAKNVVATLIAAGAEEYKVGDVTFDLTKASDIKKLINNLSSDPQYACTVSKSSGELTGTIDPPGQVSKPAKFTGGTLKEAPEAEPEK